MHCKDLYRNLDAPEGSSTAAELADHLASCHRCAEEARRSAQLDRIWRATRPAEPTRRDLDALWARASAALDAPRPAVIPFEAPARRQRWPMAVLFAAQAAAVLVAASYLLRKEVAPVMAVAPIREHTVDVYKTLIVRIDAPPGKRAEVLDDSDQFAFSSMADSTQYDAFGAVESMVSNAAVESMALP